MFFPKTGRAAASSLPAPGRWGRARPRARDGLARNERPCIIPRRTPTHTPQKRNLAEIRNRADIGNRAEIWKSGRNRVEIGNRKSGRNRKSGENWKSGNLKSGIGKEIGRKSEIGRDGKDFGRQWTFVFFCERLSQKHSFAIFR